ncbi:hypothetical protein MKK75_30670 [Methylobacterium sp. J-030]|uniref:hypothetical protein n=1 Tax=Methylobacterium sp. J-030 TaxID=2836627 RepID=UPI001FB97B59|nr:hypothetical protein [Methylobacterium sp. J-030]MCJ2073098.1 hypothetical protein [Methylobacterium sp. J-030]
MGMAEGYKIDLWMFHTYKRQLCGFAEQLEEISGLLQGSTDRLVIINEDITSQILRSKISKPEYYAASSIPTASEIERVLVAYKTHYKALVDTWNALDSDVRTGLESPPANLPNLKFPKK